jgi:hypothetical protein
VLAALGVRRDPLPGEHRVPGETTLRRVLTTVDGDALDAAVTAWLVDRLPAPGPRQPRAIAVDGKTLRGATQPGGRPVHLLAALDHAAGAVLAHHQVDGAPEEVTGFPPLLAGLDLTGVTVTADAPPTKRDAAKFLVTDKHAHDLLTVKANQPTLHAQLRQLPWHDVPVLQRSRDRGHGRVETGSLKVVTGPGLGFPYPCQALPITRRLLRPSPPPLAHRRRLRGHRPDLHPGQPRAAGRPARWALDDREHPALGTRRDLHRGRLPGADRDRTPRHGHPWQPPDRRATPGRDHQHRCRAPTYRP